MGLKNQQPKARQHQPVLDLRIRDKVHIGDDVSWCNVGLTEHISETLNGGISTDVNHFLKPRQGSSTARLLTDLDGIFDDLHMLGTGRLAVVGRVVQWFAVEVDHTNDNGHLWMDSVLVMYFGSELCR